MMRACKEIDTRRLLVN